MTRRSAAAFVGALVLGGATLVARDAPEPPPFANVRAAHRPSDARLLDRNGVVLQEMRTDPRVRRLDWVTLAEVAPALRNAIVAAEDRRFPVHHGVDWRALARAALARATGRPAGGASTITMQLAALLDGASDATGRRDLAAKWRQMRGAWALERRWSKDEILEAYLNRVAFRGELEGVGAAASVLFGKASHGVGTGEALVLAALLRAPNADEAAIAARARALARIIGEPEADVASAAAHAAARDVRMPRIVLAPHAGRRLLAGRTAGDVHSTLDAALQRVASESLCRQLLTVREGRVGDGAVLVVDDESGDVLAYVASSGALSQARNVDAIVARRQPGSALKPFLYALAFDQRLLTPESLIDDAPLEIGVAGGIYRPGNYDEHFHGLVPARVALASSLNVPAVRTLGLVGGEAFTARLRALGFAGFRESAEFYGPAVALGSAEVSLWELVNAYRALANGGVWSPIHLTRDTDPADAPRRVYGAAAAALVTDVLADREARSLTFGLESPLATPFWTAVKTGTSSDMRDNWCVGFSSRYTVGVWVGNASGASMRQVSGITGAAPVWAEVMAWLHRTTPSAAPPAVATGPSAPVAAATTRIAAPVGGTRFALDPDLPADRQRVPFVASGADVGMRWRLDGTDAGPAARPLLWEPRRGAHRLELIDDARRPHDAVDFSVR
jgi:penicillin-binding protein 1C